MADYNKIYLPHCSLTIELEGGSSSLTLDTKNFIHYIRDEFYSTIGRPSVGLSIPVAELKFKHYDVSNIIKLITDPDIRIVIGYAEANTLPTTIYQYLISNYDLTYSKSEVTVTLYLLADLGEFITESRQASYADQTFIDAIDSLGTIKIVNDDNISSDDSQTWIQPNITDYQFVSNSIRHAKASSDGDIILSAINYSSSDMQSLRVRNYSNIIKDSNSSTVYITTGQLTNSIINSYKNAYYADSILVESSIGAYQYVTSVASIPTLKILDDNTESTNIFSTFFSGGKSTATVFESDRIQPSKLDCGNTHDNYWQIRVANEKKLADIYRNIYYIEISGTNFVDTQMINILDAVFVDISLGEGDDASQTDLSGKGVVLGVSRYIDDKGVHTRLTIAKELTS